MKIGIVSDSHDNVPKLRRAVQIFVERGCEAVIHCGDFVAPFSVKALAEFPGRVMGVFGNNDGEKTGIVKVCADIVEPPHVFEVGGRRILAAHDIAQVPADPEADVLIYGHTHKKEIVPGRPMRINPGECGGWLGYGCTVVVLDAETLEAEFIEL